MSTNKQLVIQHLENISWEVLGKYPDVIRTFIKGKAGVYALYKNEHLYYVGLAKNLMGRIKQHLKDKHKGRWNRFSVYLTVKDEHMRELESLTLRMIKPTGNKIVGKFASSTNLKKTITRKIQALENSRLNKYMGGNEEKNKIKSILKNKHNKNYFVGVISKRIPLRGNYKGKLFHATLRKDGTFSHNNKIYLSPTAAAKAVTGNKVVNGRWFWKFKKNEKWVRLNQFGV